MKALGKTYNDAEARTDGFERLPAGGYVCKITEVKDVTASEYLQVVYDIAEGPYKGFYGDDWGKEHPKAHSLFMSYKEKALGMFKGRLKAIDESNGTEFVKEAVNGLKEQQLVGKLVGFIIGEEEYESDRGEVRTSMKVRSVVPIDRIREGNFKVPELKKLEAKAAPTADPMAGFSLADADLPFES